MLGKSQVVSDSMAMVSKGFAPHEVSNSSTKFNSNSTRNQSQSATGAGCTHCGNPKHTKETCFKLHGYPEWWKELKKKRQESEKARAGVVVSENYSVFPSGESKVQTEPAGYSNEGDNWAWY
ncbi:uncharacterized protein LOC144560731 [Carex rostrata]